MVKEFNRNDLFLKDPLIQKMVNLLTRDGKKSKAEKIFRKLFLSLEKGFPGQGLEIFYLAVFNTQALVGNQIKPRGKKYRKTLSGKESFVPYFFYQQRSQTLAIRSLVQTGKAGLAFKPLYQNLSHEILQASLKQGDVIAGKYSLYTQASINRRYYRYRWTRILPKNSDHLF